MLSANGALHDMIEAGARICETACGFCIGMGQSPCTNAVSVRTNNPQLLRPQRHQERRHLPG